MTIPTKILWFDTETTGLDPVKNDIIQLAGIIVIDGQEKESFNIKMQPYDFNQITQEAIDTHGYQIEDIWKFQPPKEAAEIFINLIQKYVNPDAYADKMYFGGFNVGFDVDFLRQFFLKSSLPNIFKYFNFKKIDPLPLLHIHDFTGRFCLRNYKLETVCKEFEIEIQAHDALSDIRATRELLQKLIKIPLLRKVDHE